MSTKRAPANIGSKRTDPLRPLGKPFTASSPTHHRSPIAAREPSAAPAAGAALFAKSDPVVYVTVLKSDLVTLQRRFDDLQERWSGSAINGVSTGMMKIERALLGITATNNEQQNTKVYLHLLQMLVEKLAELCRWLLVAGEINPEPVAPPVDDDPGDILLPTVPSGRPASAAPTMTPMGSALSFSPTASSRPASAMGWTSPQARAIDNSKLSSIQPIMQVVLELSTALMNKRADKLAADAAEREQSASKRSSVNTIEDPVKPPPVALPLDNALSASADAKLAKLLSHQEKMADTLDQKLNALSPLLGAGGKRLSQDVKHMPHANTTSAADAKEMERLRQRVKDLETKMRDSELKVQQYQQAAAAAEKKYDKLVQENQSWLSERENLYAIGKIIDKYQKYYHKASFHKAFIGVDVEFMETLSINTDEIDEELLVEPEPMEPEESFQTLPPPQDHTPAEEKTKGGKGKKEDKGNKKIAQQAQQEEEEKQKALEAQRGMHMSQLEEALAVQRDLFLKVQEIFKKTRTEYIELHRQQKNTIEGLEIRIVGLNERAHTDTMAHEREIRELNAIIEQTKAEGQKMIDSYNETLTEKTRLPPKVLTMSDPVGDFDEQERVKQAIRQKDALIVEVQAQLADAKTQIVALEQEVETLATAKTAAEEALAADKATVQSATTELKKMEEEVDQLRQHAEACEARAITAESYKDDHAEELRRMKVDLHIADHSAKDFRRLENELIDKANEEISKSELMKERLHQSREAKKCSELELTQKLIETQKLCDTYRKSAADHERRAEEILAKYMELSKLEDDHTRLQADFTNFAKARQEFFMKASQEEEQLLQLCKTVESTVVDESIDEVPELEYKISLLQAEIEKSVNASMNANANSYRKRLLEGMTNKLAELQLIAYEKMLQTAKIDEDCHELERDIGRLQVRNEDLQQQLNDSHVHNTLIAATNEKLEKERDNATNATKHLETTITQLQDSETKLKQEVVDKNNQLSDVTVMVTKKDHEVNWMKHQLALKTPKKKGRGLDTSKAAAAAEPQEP
eukprot:TRINITY_DN65618_c0_g1_i5.p1 TRINITY_DN65618_c0_g1~~TRINITY_DN65618_c0_g1_i5.p1  ORF type:complete len:1040 (+),score=156.52 TRINITY_DN65618_c0_g1_i5:104-3223(+)